MLSKLPFFEPIIEDEEHVLRNCKRYDDLRMKISPTTRGIIMGGSDIHAVFDDQQMIKHLGDFIRRLFARRFPKKEEVRVPGKGKKSG